MINEIADKNPSLDAIRAKARLGGGEDQIEKQHKKGKLTSRERIKLLLDPDSVWEIGMFVTHRATGFGMEQKRIRGDGVVTGWGKIDGRTVYIYAQDFTVMGGSVGEEHGRKIAKVMKLARQNGAPVIGLNDSGGARIQEGVAALAGYGEIFHQNVLASGVIPQITVIMGPCAGGAVYSPAITDFVIMVEKTAHMFITGPEVVKAVTHEDVSLDDLGGSVTHCSTSGVAHFSALDEETALIQVRLLLSYLPSNNLTPPPQRQVDDDPGRMVPELSRIVPTDPQSSYDVHEVINTLVDSGEFLEIQSEFAKNIVVGFAHLDGNPVGIVAN
ncbi:MAG: methylmalonyl-CoA carboxyltransferase, partial [Anaerolineaceae bacterium]|nr:methylmalonyl-CoA carboxyltransferase [Anaerolineaceae bacterium]